MDFTKGFPNDNLYFRTTVYYNCITSGAVDAQTYC